TPGSRLPAAGSRPSNPESRIPNPKSRIPNPESRIPNPGSRVPNPESRVSNPESPIPNPGSGSPLRGTYEIAASGAVVAGYEARDVKARGRIDGNTIRLDVSGGAYGGRATAAGTIRTGAPLALDLTGRAANVDLRNLPSQVGAPRVPGTLQFA